MKTIALILCLLCSGNVVADGWQLHLEQGQTTSYLARPEHYQPANYAGVLLRYGDGFFYELSQGGWRGENNTGRYIGLGIGGRSQNKWYAEYTVSMVRLIEPDTEQLDGNKQYLLSLGIGCRVDDLLLTLRYKHLSNGNSNGSNHGLEFGPVFSAGVVF